MIARLVAGLCSAAMVIGACSPPASGSAGPPDRARAADQARTFHTMATADRWANYGNNINAFCQASFGFDCNRDDRDVGSDLTSGQEVQQWDAERNNPQSVLADLNLLFIPQAEEAGVLADYEPPNAGLLPDNLHGPGWVATFVGVPDILVNIDALEARQLSIPATWSDLTDARYRGLISMHRVGIAAGGTFAFVAMNLAAGGTLEDWQPGIEFARRLLPNLNQAPSFETFASGEVPIALRLDFSSATWLPRLDEAGVRYRHMIPTEGSVYAPATLMLNRYDTAHHDFGKMFLEWVISDEGQFMFAPSGARPIRSMLEDNPLVVPAEYRVNWLPDAEYENVAWVDWTLIDPQALQQMWEEEVVGGS
jgi:putative spermidine/putrescine transport system substrate-binding protein